MADPKPIREYASVRLELSRSSLKMVTLGNGQPMDGVRIGGIGSHRVSPPVE